MSLRWTNVPQADEKREVASDLEKISIQVQRLGSMKDVASKKKSTDDLRAIKDRVKDERELREDGYPARITVHMGSCGLASGAQKVIDRVLHQASQCGRSDIVIGRSGCIGLCSREPLVTVEVSGKEPIIYQQVDDEKMERIFKQHVLAGKVQVDLALARGKAINEDPMPRRSDFDGIIPHTSQVKFFALQQCWVLHNKGLIDPEKIDDYIWRDGYLGAAKALLEMSPAEIISEIKTSGLRSRDRRGFPLGIQWEFCASSKNDRYVLCNADEGDSDNSVNHGLLEADPHAVVEGMIVAAKAIHSHRGYIHCRAEYPLAVKRLTLAIDQARSYGLLGTDIFGSGFDFDIEVDQGTNAFEHDDETGSKGSIKEHCGIPRLRSRLAGFWNEPIALNNVETYANIPQIILHGGEAYADIGTESSKGTKVFSLAGKVNHTGLIEVPMGTPLGEIIFDIGGGIPGGKRFKAVQLGALSGGYIPGEYLNIPTDYEAISKTGASIGSGGMVVMDADTCMVDMARRTMDFCQDESCANGTPCRTDVKSMLEILQRICRGRGYEGDIDLLEDLSQRVKDRALCGLGQTASNSILSTIRHFRHEYEAHIHDKHCPAAVCSDLFRSPCQHTCPVGMDVPAYIALIGAGRIDDAYKVLRRTNPFPSVCGRVCDHICQLKCRRGQIDEPVAIMHLKRFVTDNANRPKADPLPVTQKERVAIVGAGPSGLAAALELKKRGYAITMFEELPEPGGMLRWGIPAYRLPRNELNRDIEEILQTGVELRTNTCVGRDVTLEELDRSFDIIYLAVGAQKSLPLNIPGGDAEGVFGAVEFLRASNMSKTVKVGKHVAVIGHGKPATDAARTAIRLGAKQVTLYDRHERNDIWAREPEIRGAEEEGVKMMYLVAPVRVMTQYGKVRGLELTQMRLEGFDPSGRKQPKPILGSEFIEKAETVIFAFGRGSDLGFLTKDSGIEIDQNKVKVDKSLRTTNVKIWAGGDMVTGPTSVIDAIKAGQTAARAMDTAIRSAKGEGPWVAPDEEEIDIPFEVEEKPAERPQTPMPEVPPKARRNDFREVDLGYTSEMALAEVRRCMRCDGPPKNQGPRGKGRRKVSPDH